MNCLRREKDAMATRVKLTEKGRALVNITKRARGFIRKGWCQGYFARTASGVATGPRNPSAAKWCLVGSLSAADHHSTLSNVVLSEMNRLLQKTGVGHSHAASFNDDPSTEKSDVLRLLMAAERHFIRKYRRR